MAFSEGEIQFNANLGSDIRARGSLDNSDSRDINLNALDLAFDTELRNENTSGLYLYGYIPSLDLDEWLDVLASGDGENGQMLQSVELEFDEISAFNQQLTNVDFQLEHSNGQFIGLVDSSLIRGNFQLLDSGREPVNIDLEYLRIDKNEVEAEGAPILTGLVPGDFPDFKLKSQSLVFHDLLFNDLDIEARVDGDRMFVDRIKMRRDDVHLAASGRWEHETGNNQHQTVMSVAVNGQQFGQAIAALGFGDSISDGVVDLTAGFNWAAPPHQGELEKPGRRCQIEIDPGRIE